MTEEVTGVDLVQAQIKVAGGATLASLGLGSQEQVPACSGYALQCRITSEDPERNFQVGAGGRECMRVCANACECVRLCARVCSDWGLGLGARGMERGRQPRCPALAPAC